MMAMHHLTPEEKLRLYWAVHEGLKPGGFYIEGDYVVTKGEEEELFKRYAGFRRMHPEVANGRITSTSRSRRRRSFGFS